VKYSDLPELGDSSFRIVNIIGSQGSNFIIQTKICFAKALTDQKKEAAKQKSYFKIETLFFFLKATATQQSEMRIQIKHLNLRQKKLKIKPSKVLVS